MDCKNCIHWLKIKKAKIGVCQCSISQETRNQMLWIDPCGLQCKDVLLTSPNFHCEIGTAMEIEVLLATNKSKTDKTEPKNYPLFQRLEGTVTVTYTQDELAAMKGHW